MLRERDINVVRYMVVCVSEFTNRFNIEKRNIHEESHPQIIE